MTDESRIRFQIPQPVNKDPAIEPGELLREWIQDGVRFQLRMDGDVFIVLRDGDNLNRLHVPHQNFELLVLHCKSMGYNVPDLPN
jgi:hypothetical protein